MPPELCDNRADDDGDGDADCADLDCADAAACQAPVALTQAEIQTLVERRCSCHVNGQPAGLNMRGDFTAQTVNVASREAPGLDRIEPGDHQASYLWHKLNGTQVQAGGNGGRMPDSGPVLDQATLDGIRLFIDGLPR